MFVSFILFLQPKRPIMYKPFLLLIVLILLSHEATAQRSITVLDMDTDLPVKGVSVRVDQQRSVETDHLGRATIPVLFDSIAFSHVRYERERLAMVELSDTMYLLPIEHMLPEVKVNAASPEMLAAFKAWAQMGAMAGAAEAPRGVASFDFASLLDRRGRRDKKHLERAKEILKEWDKAPSEEDKK